MASTSSATGGFLSSPRAQRRFLWISGGVLVIGIAAFVSVVVLRGSSGIHAPFSGKAKFAPKLVKAPPPPVAYKIARTFIETAPERQNLDVAYRLVGPELKGTMTLKQWEKGNIAVDPYKPENAKTAAFITDWSYTNQILFEVALVAKPGTQAPQAPKTIQWFLGLRKLGGKNGRWVVNYWLPNWHPPVQLGGVGGN
jgi:hypothetical protein